MKTIFFVLFFISSLVSAQSSDLQLRGVVQEEIFVEVSGEDSSLQVKTNAIDRNIPVRISRRPSSIIGHEQLEIIIP